MSPSRNIVVGAFVLGGILLFGLGLFLIGNRRMLFTESFHVYADFAGVAGLATGAKVRVGGMDAGEIVEIAVPPGPARKFRIKARVVEKLRPLVRTDSVATIQTDGIVGNKFVQIDPGSEQATAAHDGSTIQSREPFDIADLMEELRKTIGIANRTVLDVKDELEQALRVISATAGEAQDLIASTGKDVKSIAASGAKITEDVQLILADVKAGRGTVGKLFTDDKLYGQLRGITSDLSETAKNARTTSEDVSKVVADLRAREVMGEVEKTVRNVRQVTDQVKTAMAGFQPGGNGASLTTDLRQTLSFARETMSDMADNTEALKRNWFFRGFFKGRGFYDLDLLTPAQYKRGDFAKGRKTMRAWLSQQELFSRDTTGAETLTAEGRKRIDDSIAQFIQHPRNGILVVEGYAGQGSAADQYIASLSRATAVRDYIEKKYGWKPNYLGTMPMGAVRSGPSRNGPPWDGVALVLFYTEEKPSPTERAEGQGAAANAAAAGTDGDSTAR